jgi:hypothetical protein
MMTLNVRGRDNDLFRSTILCVVIRKTSVKSDPVTSGYDAVPTSQIPKEQFSVSLGGATIHLQCSLKASRLPFAG